ncbi:hypothetical protein LZ198_12185 [Myxococcus sp. K15C18031901]|uniref:hypothetical protein n=1 Tax=Myxococcus dinghuensis TaxID=2906761 RepID=UPI0020A82E8A|nr:hypothetical protein [Myxococcus dinghuensis]MCP3099626.1 hypothetical protein [Myxococcus dinghuensis]
MFAPFRASAHAEASALASVRAEEAELSTGGGLLTGGSTFDHGRTGDTYLASVTTARYLLGGFTLDGGLQSLLPLEQGTRGGRTRLSARLGYTGARWSLVVGAVLGLAYTAHPHFEALPTARGLYRLGDTTALEAGLFDAQGQLPGHVGVSWRGLGLGYVFPLGGRARWDIPVAPRASLRLEGALFQHRDVRTTLVTLGVVGRPSAANRTPSGRNVSPPGLENEA